MDIRLQFDKRQTKLEMKQNTKLIASVVGVMLIATSCSFMQGSKDFDREYFLEASMLGYFDENGTRNPVLRAERGESVRIRITNGENMTHDIALEKLGVKSEVLVQEGDTASIIFTASEDDVYFCTIPGHRAAGMVGRFEVVEEMPDMSEVVAGVPPVRGGEALNLGFETGNLDDWSQEGDAFSLPLVRNDTSEVHGKDTPIGLSGKYFVSSGGMKFYQKTGVLTSVPFEVTHPFASFKVSGGALQDTRVELVRAESDKVFFQITGSGRATLQPVVVEVDSLMGEEIYIRLIDNETGISQIPYIRDDKMAHINFDDFQFYPKRPYFSNELRPEDIIILPPLDPVLHSGLSGDQAAKSMTVPEGFSVTLAAAEPDIVRPIAFTTDARGRLWVAEAHTYPVRAPEGKGRDRVLIFEDTNGDGTLDKRKVFAENLNLISGIEVGMGGVFLGSAPHLLYIPLNEKTDKPAGPPQILLDGWGLQDTHEVLNSFRWGPDGWLYGTHGVFTHSNVGRPGAPDSERVKLNAGVWRYHPTTKRFELFAEGTSNPWGIDFNDYGHPFITVCVIPHMFHVIQGARYRRQAGKHFNPHTYKDIQEICDHVHWVGDRGPHAGNFRSNAKGGGHAHAGAMIYLGNPKWPEQYRNMIFMNNIHGSRVNVDKLTRQGSGYTASHENDFLLTNDSWSQWLNFRYMPSGSVYAIDWYDKNQCHSPNPDVHDKTMGRIFRISHATDKWAPVDLSKESGSALVKYQLEANEWYVRTARLILQERGPDPEVHRALKQILNEHPDVTRKLRALWALHVTKGLSENDLLGLLDHKSEYLRGWAIQLLAEDKNLSDVAIRSFLKLAKEEPSASVRLNLASALQRTPAKNRWDIIEALVQRSEDKDDHNLPLMLWYALEPCVPEDVDRAAQLAMKAQLPDILVFTTRRIAAIKSDKSVKALKELKRHLEEMEHGAHHAELSSLLKEIEAL